VTDVYLEVGGKRTFACAVDWPGWCRAGKDEDGALEALAAYAGRYAAAAKAAKVAFRPPGGIAAPRFEVVERVAGNAATDFGAPGIVPKLDTKADLAARDRSRLAALVKASWKVLDDVVASAPATLRKGPRGGGRDRDAIAAHVRDAESAYGRKIGVRGGDRDAMLAVIRSGDVEVLSRAKPWPIRYAARRIAWHALDHAWEIEDRSES
jgi:hypothetical protein